MNLKEITKPVTAKSLNETLAKRFGSRINIDKFTNEQLEDARNKLRTQLSSIETTESFDNVHKSDAYQKSKLFLDVINASIAERSEGLNEFSPENEKDADEEDIPQDKRIKKGAMKKEDTKDKAVKEGKEDEAELVMAAKDMVDRVTGWMEDTAEMQTESMLELADAIRDELGIQQSDAFVQTIKPALEAMYDDMETTRGSLTQGVGLLTGEGEPVDTMGDEVADAPVEPEAEMEPTVDQEDEFAAAAPAAGGEEEAGRAKRESIEMSRRMGILLTGSSKKKSLKPNQTSAQLN